MKHLLCVAFLALATPPFVVGADVEKLTYYVQLIRGNDAATPPVPEAKRVGPKLSKQFRPVFKWESYWEMNRQQVELARGQKTKLKLSQEREVEIDLTDPAKRKVTAYSAGKPICATTSPAAKTMTIIGADRGPNSAWFIVVRRDKPSME